MHLPLPEFLDEVPAVFCALFLLMVVAGASAARWHEKRHPYYKPDAGRLPQPFTSSLSEFVQGAGYFDFALTVSAALILALYLLRKLFEFLWS